MVEDASGDVAAEDARDVNTQLQVEMIQQQRKTNALLRARAQTVSASLAPARTRTRLVQQQQHHARSGCSRLKNETPPITELSQERSSMQRPALATPCPLALRSAAAWTRTGTGTRARTRPAPRACPDSTTRRPCRGRLSFGEKIGEITEVLKAE